MEQLIDSINVALDKNYIFPEKSKAIADHLKTRLKEGAYVDPGEPSKIGGQLQADMDVIHRDPHMRIYYEPGSRESVDKESPTQPDSMQVRKERLNNFSFQR